MTTTPQIGAIKAIKAAKRTGIKVVGINGQSTAFDAIKSGDMYGTVIQSPTANVEVAFKVLDMYLNKQTIPPYTYSESQL